MRVQYIIYIIIEETEIYQENLPLIFAVCALDEGLLILVISHVPFLSSSPQAAEIALQY